MERVGLSDEPQSAGRVRGEDRHVLLERGAEELEHFLACPLGELGHRRRGRVERVRVAEHVRSQQLGMLAELRVRVDAGAGVIEVDVAARLEAGEVAATQLVEYGGGGVPWMRAQKGRLGCLRQALCHGVDGRLTSISVSTGTSSEAETRQVSSACSASWRACPSLAGPVSTSRRSSSLVKPKRPSVRMPATPSASTFSLV